MTMLGMEIKLEPSTRSSVRIVIKSDDKRQAGDDCAWAVIDDVLFSAGERDPKRPKRFVVQDFFDLAGALVTIRSSHVTDLACMDE